MSRKPKGEQTLAPYQQGIRVFFDKKYIWLTNHKGALELHGLHRPVPQDAKEEEA